MCITICTLTNYFGDRYSYDELSHDCCCHIVFTTLAKTDRSLWGRGSCRTTVTRECCCLQQKSSSSVHYVDQSYRTLSYLPLYTAVFVSPLILRLVTRPSHCWAFPVEKHIFLSSILKCIHFTWLLAGDKITVSVSKRERGREREREREREKVGWGKSSFDLFSTELFP